MFYPSPLYKKKTKYTSEMFPKGNLYFTCCFVLSVILTINVGFAQNDAKKLFNRGYYMLTVDKTDAINYLSQTIQADSSYTEAYYHRGIAYFKLGEYEKALADFDKTYALNPDLAITWMYKGFTYRNQAKYDLALDAFSNYISANPTDTSAYSYILQGKMKYELGDFKGAADDYDMALKLQPFKEKYHYYKYLSYYEAEMFDQALESLDLLLSTNSNFYGYYFYKGQVYLELKNYQKAIDMFNIAIIKNYSNADSYFFRAIAFESLGKYEEALEDYNTAVLLKPEEGTYFSKRGNCKYSMDRKLEACRDWDKAGALGYYEDFDKMKKICESLTDSASN